MENEQKIDNPTEQLAAPSQTAWRSLSLSRIASKRFVWLSVFALVAIGAFILGRYFNYPQVLPFALQNVKHSTPQPQPTSTASQSARPAPNIPQVIFNEQDYGIPLKSNDENVRAATITYIITRPITQLRILTNGIYILTFDTTLAPIPAQTLQTDDTVVVFTANGVKQEKVSQVKEGDVIQITGAYDLKARKWVGFDPKFTASKQ